MTTRPSQRRTSRPKRRVLQTSDSLIRHCLVSCERAIHWSPRLIISRSHSCRFLSCDPITAGEFEYVESLRRYPS
jgi:hypothetical protein